MADDAVRGAGWGSGRPIQRGPIFGMESLDVMGIDIDQDPHAFAKFLELKKPITERPGFQTPGRPARFSSPSPARRDPRRAGLPVRSGR